MFAKKSIVELASVGLRKAFNKAEKPWLFMRLKSEYPAVDRSRKNEITVLA